MPTLPKQRWISIALGALVSAGAIGTLLAIVSPRDLADAFSVFNGAYLAPFILTVVLMITCFGYRWHILLSRRISLGLAVKAMLINMGGNMVLPARGGDLLRIHFSRAEGGLPVAVMLGALFTEKVADLLAICFIGALGAALLGLADIAHKTLFASATAVFAIVAGTAIFIRTRNSLVQRAVKWALCRMHRESFFHAQASPLIAELGATMGLRAFSRTMAVTLVLWLGIYAVSYLGIAGLVGVRLSYPEALVVLWASGLGLMIPAAPSGLGVYHATVVSAFYFLGRPLAQGLVLGTALHISFFVALVVPMGLLYGKWLFKRNAPP